MALGGFNELDFLLHIPILNNDDNRDSIFNWVRGGFDFDEKGNLDGNTEGRDTSRSIVYKNKNAKDTQSLKNYYKTTIYKYSLADKESDLNPYLKLIRDFSDTTFNAMRFEAAHFAYLTDLGVYPMNRLWVLRRFTDATTVPNNLQEWNGTPPEPRYTMVGWIKPEDDKFFSVSFNETWTTINERLDQVIFKILEEEFKLKAGDILSLPGWSQGLLFGFLNAMEITGYNSTNIPQGNPSVLQEAATRANNANPGYGNVSDISITLKTSYEQKYIGDVDPGNAMLDLIHNCIYMGTRNTEFVLNGPASGGVLDALRKANAAGTDLSAWWDFIVKVVEAFVTAINKLFTDFDGSGKESKGESSKNKAESPKPAEEAKNKLLNDSGIKTTFQGPFQNGAKSLVQTILASTVMKWRYAMMGSIALMTGENSTPWHLTLGNPYSPFLSTGNIVVKNVTMNFNNEFGFNDIPTRLDVEVQVALGRNLGAQEIFRMFNNGYQRAYATNDVSVVKKGDSETEKLTAISNVTEDQPKPTNSENKVASSGGISGAGGVV